MKDSWEEKLKRLKRHGNQMQYANSSSSGKKNTIKYVCQMEDLYIIWIIDNIKELLLIFKNMIMAFWLHRKCLYSYEMHSEIHRSIIGLQHTYVRTVCVIIHRQFLRC